MASVLVTGAGGYIGLHVTRVLLEQGYKVRGTVRSTKNEAKTQAIKQCCPNAKYPVELVEANLTSDEGWKEAVDGMDYIIHVASPFPNAVPKNPDELVVPAVEGTLRVLRHASQTSTVKRIVLTSSIVAMHGQTEGGDPNDVYDESEFTDLNSPSLPPYERSKTLAEQAAWKFIKSEENKNSMELVTICPALVIGPMINKIYGTSVEMLLKFVDGSMPMVPAVTLPFCDVRDVAEAHVKALSVKEAAGERVCVFTKTLWMIEAAKILQSEFAPMGYSVPKMRAPNMAIRFFSLFDSGAASAIPRLDKMYIFSNSKMKTLLKMEPRPVEQSIVETIHSLIEAGIVKKASKYQPKPISMSS